MYLEGTITHMRLVKGHVDDCVSMLETARDDAAEKTHRAVMCALHIVCSLEERMTGTWLHELQFAGGDDCELEIRVKDDPHNKLANVVNAIPESHADCTIVTEGDDTWLEVTRA